MQQTTEAQRTMLGARNLSVGFGAELLDANDQLVPGVSLDLAGGEVQRDNYATVHGSCQLDLLRELDWSARPRVRLFQTLGDGSTTTVTTSHQLAGGGVHLVSRKVDVVERFNLGVYVLTTPETPIGESPATYQVEGYDKLVLLSHAVGDTYVVPAGTGYLAAAQQAITDAGATGLPALFDTTAAATTLTNPMVWVLDPQNPTAWLSVVNNLLAAIGYRGLWCDQDGRYRSEPYQAPTARAPEWVLDTTNPQTTIVGEDRTYRRDSFTATNWWRFVADDLQAQPSEGAGYYTVDQSAGGVQHRRVVSVTAADQASLVSQGGRIVAEDTQVRTELDLATGPLPILGHMDVLTYTDPTLGTFKCLARSHTLPLDGGDVSLQLVVVS